MKIAVVVPSFPEISETFIVNHITGLIDEGHDVTIIALRKKINSPRHQAVDDYHLLNKTVFVRNSPANKVFRRVYSAGLILAYSLRYPLKMFRAVSHLLRKDRIDIYQKLYFLFAVMTRPCDIFHFHFGEMGRLGAAVKIMGVPITMITSFHGADVNQIPLQEGKNCYLELFKYGDHFVANTEFTKTQAVNLGCDGKKISVIPVGLQIRDFPFRPRSSVGNETIEILTVGRLVEKKGHQYSIQAIARLIKDGFNVHYTIAGDGSLRNELERLAQTCEISAQVSFLGEVTQKEAVGLYEKSHLFVLPSITARNGDKEGQALVLQEAQACGLPVISTFHNGIPDGVLDGQSGVLVPEKDVISLTEAIQKLLENPSRWPAMGQKGRQFVESKYENKRLISQMLSLYKAL